MGEIRLAMGGNTKPLLEALKKYMLTQGADFLRKQLISAMGPTLKTLGLTPTAALIALKDIDQEELKSAYESGDLEPILDRFKDYAWMQTQSFLLDQLVDRLSPDLLKSAGFPADLEAVRVVLKETLTKDELNQ